MSVRCTSAVQLLQIQKCLEPFILIGTDGAKRWVSELVQGRCTTRTKITKIFNPLAIAALQASLARKHTHRFKRLYTIPLHRGLAVLRTVCWAFLARAKTRKNRYSNAMLWTFTFKNATHFSRYLQISTVFVCPWQKWFVHLCTKRLQISVPSVTSRVSRCGLGLVLCLQYHFNHSSCPWTSPRYSSKFPANFSIPDSISNPLRKPWAQRSPPYGQSCHLM